MAMNVRLLRKIQRKIQDSPELFNMRKFTGMNECGTTHCLVGWAVSLYRGRRKKGDWSGILGINRDQFMRLFYANEWPRRFRGRKDEWSPTIKQAVARIDHFIATNGAE